MDKERITASFECAEICQKCGELMKDSMYCFCTKCGTNCEFLNMCEVGIEEVEDG